MHTTKEKISNKANNVQANSFAVSKTPHRDKLLAAIENHKAKADVHILKEALCAYESWSSSLTTLTTTGKSRIYDMVRLLNEYKDHLEVDLILEKGSSFLTRQKGQMKLDNSILEEFLIHLVRPEIINSLPNSDLVTGPQRAFMSLAFMPESFSSLFEKPSVVIKAKDQDFILGAKINYSFQAGKESNSQSGAFSLAAMAVECKVNLDKTMFQEASGTATRLRQGCPFTKYYLLAEYLDMTPEDVRLTDIENVFLIRKAKRLPYEKRTDIPSVRAQRRDNPICPDIIWSVTQEIQSIVTAVWYNPQEVLNRGSFK